jgi:hypothetical protein
MGSLCRRHFPSINLGSILEMQRFKVLGMGLLTVFVLAAVATSVASAETVLPEFTVESKIFGTTGKSKLNLTGAAIPCNKGSFTGSATSKKLGTGTLWFLECKIGGEECHSLGDGAGNILITGTGTEYHVVRLKTADAGVWLLFPATHIECKFEGLLIVVKGNVLGLITPILVKTKVFTVNVNVVAGAQEITTFENDAGEKVTAKLEGSISGGAFKAATEESAENKFTAEKETEIVKTT